MCSRKVALDSVLNASSQEEFRLSCPPCVPRWFKVKTCCVLCWHERLSCQEARWWVSKKKGSCCTPQQCAKHSSSPCALPQQPLGALTGETRTTRSCQPTKLPSPLLLFGSMLPQWQHFSGCSRDVVSPLTCVEFNDPGWRMNELQRRAAPSQNAIRWDNLMALTSRNAVWDYFSKSACLIKLVRTYLSVSEVFTTNLTIETS